MPQLCSKQEALLRLFYNASSSFLLLFILFFSSSLLLLKFFNFIGNFPIIHRDQQYEYVFSEEEEEEEIRYSYVDHQSSNITHERDHHLVADIIGGGESLVFLHTTPSSSDHDQFTSPRESLVSEEAQEEEDHNYYASDHQTLSVHRSPQVSDFETEIEQEQVQTHEYEYDSVPNSVPIETRPTSPTPITLNLYKSDVATDTTDEISISDDQYYDPVGERMMKNRKVQEEAGDDHKFFVFAPSAATQHSKRNIFDEEEEIYGDSCTVGSTSKSSSEWRSSVICRDSGTDDPFSSSSRRSCPKWESYTVFQKYDEEMTFLDRISAQKLHETESLKSIMVSPRSISERIVYKLAAIQKTPAHIGHNPYRELEAAYVAQICLTWEALNWNYHNFQSKVNHEGGCGASVAQQFQQFQVLLQRYIENEPYEHGRRPEIYARMRLLAPKLLLVPEYRESEEDEKEDNGFHSRISSESFVMIMEDGIRTFMNFLKADKEKPCQILAAYFRRNRRPSVDPTLLRLMKKVNQKKKMKVKDLRRSRKCLRKRKLKVEEEMQILMALIDLKIVSRVLRMSDLSEEQLHWCEEKMSKVRVMDAKLQRDPNPLFFPSH